jgi:hypothetical protein
VSIKVFKRGRRAMEVEKCIHEVVPKDEIPKE